VERHLSPAVATALARFRAALDARLGARVREVVLFGSHARGNASEKSDVDVYVVVDDATHEDRIAIFDIAYDVDATAPGGDDGWVGIEPIVHSTAQAADMRARERGLLRNIAGGLHRKGGRRRDQGRRDVRDGGARDSSAWAVDRLERIARRASSVAG
jgi:hypothetical protein